MKRVLITLAVAFCAVCANAAVALSWTVNSFTGPSGDSSKTGTAYSDLYTATLAVYTDSSLTTAVSGLGGEGKTYSSAVNKKGKILGETEAVITGTASGTTYWAVITLATQDGDYTYTTDVKEFTYSSDDLTSPDLTFSGPTSKTMWVSTSGGGGDVPEPTSGLLLLVGGAMLALRRKQK